MGILVLVNEIHRGYLDIGLKSRMSRVPSILTIKHIATRDASNNGAVDEASGTLLGSAALSTNVAMIGIPLRSFAQN